MSKLSQLAKSLRTDLGWATSGANTIIYDSKDLDNKLFSLPNLEKLMALPPTSADKAKHLPRFKKSIAKWSDDEITKEAKKLMEHAERCITYLKKLLNSAPTLDKAIVETKKELKKICEEE